MQIQHTCAPVTFMRNESRGGADCRTFFPGTRRIIDNYRKSKFLSFLLRWKKHTLLKTRHSLVCRKCEPITLFSTIQYCKSNVLHPHQLLDLAVSKRTSENLLSHKKALSFLCRLLLFSFTWHKNWEAESSLVASDESAKTTCHKE